MKPYTFPLPTSELSVSEFEELHPGVLQPAMMVFRMAFCTKSDSDTVWDLGRLAAYDIVGFQEKEDDIRREGFILRLKNP